MATLKGENFRVFVGTAPVGKATNCVVTLTNNTDDLATKDDVGMSSKPTTVSKTWQVQVDALETDDIQSLLSAIKSRTLLIVYFDETNTTNNTTPLEADFGRTGYAYLTDASFVFNDREYTTKSLQFTGVGALEKFT